MNFNFETQGPVTYLVCELDPSEVVDTLTLGMLTNNHIVGLAPVLYTELNGQRFLKYNISAKIPARHFFAGNVAKERALDAFMNIANSLCVADDYMIDQSCFVVSAEHVFLNVSSCEASLICIPVRSDKNVNAEIVQMYKYLMRSSDLEEAQQLPKLAEYLSNEAAFNIYEFQNIIEDERRCGDSSQLGAVSSQPQQTIFSPAINNTPMQNSSFAPTINNGVQPQVQNFDSTISINDAPTMFQGGNPAPIQPSIVPPTPLVPPVSPIPPASVGLGNAAGRGNTGGFTNRPNVTTPPPVVKPQPATSPVNQGFAIPGKSNIPEKNPVNLSPAGNAPQNANNSEKKMSLFGLLAHYNKENLELYKAQKAAKPAKEPKQKKQRGAAQAPSNINGGVSGAPTGMAGNHPVQAPPFGGVPAQHAIPSQPPIVPTPIVNSVPVQNQFNATTVLDNSIGETTVLSAVMPKPGEPYLTRTKNQEQVLINKPVFRIGKEKSYVDFFISDNTTISRSHANIITEHNEYYVEDMNSTNHTFVNGVMITGNQKVKINDGDRIRLANEEFTFHC